MNEKELTIFTPTYNRSFFLKRLYDSILASRYSDLVEWVIVDDGSVDNTSEVVQSFINEKKMCILYRKKSNGGKPSCFNEGIKLANSKWFVCVDDDDYFCEGGLDNLFKGLALFYKEGRAGIVGKCVSPGGDILGNLLKKDYLESDTIEIRDRYNFWGEPEIYKTEILKNYCFPIIENEKFITEAYVFDQITVRDNKKLIYTNYPMIIKQYYENGLTDNGLSIRINNPKGTIMYYKQRIILSKMKLAKFRAKLNLTRFEIHQNRKVTYLHLYLLGRLIVAKDRKELGRRK